MSIHWRKVKDVQWRKITADLKRAGKRVKYGPRGMLVPEQTRTTS
jgi:hypothetical protein